MAEAAQSTLAGSDFDRPAWDAAHEIWRDESRGLGEFLREYAQENPAAAALWCFGIGFVLGWRLKPW